ncbi:hypothetical protein QI260_12150, partial [Staphylococcus saprophyticus]|nr:hypothetical protein [Staphylococcus saprophyticus]MDW4159968.1 hypothetical protein [Staphylococcus saprophyticus]
MVGEEQGGNDGQINLFDFAVLSKEQIKAAVKLVEKAWFEKIQVITIKIFFFINDSKGKYIQSIVYKNDAKRDFCYSY